MRIALIGLGALVVGGVCVATLDAHAATIALAALAIAFVALLVRGVASVRSSLVEPTVWRSVDPSDRRIALTFDDGPDPVWTQRVLDVLEERGLRATFFVVGANVRRHPELVRNLTERGHEVGLHGDSHSRWTACFRRARMEREIEACRAAVRAACGLTPRFYRPPYGVRSPAHAGMSRGADLVVVGMARRGFDKGGGRMTADLVARVGARTRPGEIVALHDGDEYGRASTCPAADALGAILDAFAARGLSPVTVSELVGERPYVESPQPAWTGRTHGGRAGNAFFAVLVRAFGVWPALVPLMAVSAWFVIAHPRSRAASIALRRRFGGRRSAVADFLWTWRHFYTYGRTLLWRMAGMRARVMPTLEQVGYESVRSCVEADDALLLVSAHMGDWFAASRSLGAHAGSRRLAVVALRGAGLGPHQVRETTADAPYRLIDIEGGTMRVGIDIVSELRGGAAVAIHADRTIEGDEGVAVPFLGAQARFPSGPWKVALLTGAPAVVYFAIPLAADRLRIYSYGPIRVRDPGREGREAAIRAAAVEFAAHLEACVRLHPMHWGNFHDIWGAA